MLNESKIFCVIPAFNEGKNIAEVIKKVKKYIDSIVVVDDGSSDDTFDKACAENIFVLRHIINRGQGAALRTGNNFALKNGAEIIVHFDGDNQFDASDIPCFILPLVEGRADVVFGSRFMEEKSEIPFMKKFLVLPLAKLISLYFFKVNLTDPQSGFRALSRKAASKIEIEQDDMAHCTEIIMKSFRQNFRVKEVPIKVVYRKYGSGFARGIRILKDLLLVKIFN